MKRLALLIARLYPYAWRKRYGAEFEGLLGDLNPSAAMLFDTFTGALNMQIKSNGPRLAMFALAGAIIAAICSFAVRDAYVGTAVLRVRDTNSAQASMEQVLSRASLWSIVIKNRLYESERNQIPAEEVVERMRRSIKVGGGLNKWGDKPQALTLSFEGADRLQAKAVTADLAQLFLQANQNSSGLIELSSPAKPISPNRVSIVVAGLIAGLLMGSAYIFLMNKRRPA
jgi:hypothetical protein